MPEVYDNKNELELTKTLQQRKEENEKKLKQLKDSNLRSYFSLSETLENSSNRLSISSVEEIYNKKQELEKKYAKDRETNVLSNEVLEKRIANELAEYALQRERDEKLQREKDFAEYQKMVRSGEAATALQIQQTRKQNLAEEYKLQLDYLEKVKQGQLEASDTQVENAKKAQEDIRKQIAQAYGVDENNPLKGLVKENGGDVYGYYSELAGAGDSGAQMMLNGFDALENSLNGLLNNWSSMFESTIENYSKMQTTINTRLQGSGYTWNGINGIESTLTRAVGDTGYLKLQDLMDNVVEAVNNGIAYNVEQRAFLQTISDEIAATFDAFDSSLLQLIRLQQSDTTAARLGVEASMTTFLNNMFSDTSYLSDAFDSVASSLTAAMSQMTAQEGVEFEYIVQKWLGSLYSVGFDSGSISDLASAINSLGSGDISSVGNTGMGRLMLAAAGQAGLNVSQMLIDGLNSTEANQLLASMVDYLQEIAASDNKVIKSQYAEIYGLTIEDLTAVSNLAGSIDLITSSTLSYTGAINELYNQMDQLNERIGTGQRLSNMLSNVQYSIGAGIASNPATYALWEITSMIEGLTGGINLPTVSVMGNSVDLNTTVTNLMRSGIVGVSTLGAIGDIISGINSNVNPSSMLSALGINGELTTTSRGTSLYSSGKLTGATSSSAIIGNSSGEDYYETALANANNQVSTALATAEEESEAATLDDIDDYLLNTLDPRIANIESYMKSLVSSYGIATYGSNTGAMVTVSLDENSLLAESENLRTISETLNNIWTAFNGVISGNAINVKIQSNTATGYSINNGTTLGI